ncbi:unnamed protein product, partial [Bubo scandiacus]
MGPRHLLLPLLLLSLQLLALLLAAQAAGPPPRQGQPDPGGGGAAADPQAGQGAPQPDAGGAGGCRPHGAARAREGRGGRQDTPRRRGRRRGLGPGTRDVLGVLRRERAVGQGVRVQQQPDGLPLLLRHLLLPLLLQQARREAQPEPVPQLQEPRVGPPHHRQRRAARRRQQRRRRGRQQVRPGQGQHQRHCLHLVRGHRLRAHRRRLRQGGLRQGAAPAPGDEHTQ